MSGRWLGAFLLALSCSAHADIGFRDLSDPDAPQWKEEEVAFPAFPRDEDLREFYVSELTAHRFFIDGASLNAGKDGVVRYTLVVRTRGGATNISFEGIHCERREFRIYATGQRNGSWVSARQGQWRPIENKPMNRHHAALSRELFCPGGTPIRSADEGREALRLGRHPAAL